MANTMSEREINDAIAQMSKVASAFEGMIVESKGKQFKLFSQIGRRKDDKVYSLICHSVFPLSLYLNLRFSAKGITNNKFYISFGCDGEDDETFSYMHDLSGLGELLQERFFEKYYPGMALYEQYLLLLQVD